MQELELQDGPDPDVCPVNRCPSEALMPWIKRERLVFADSLPDAALPLSGRIDSVGELELRSGLR
jgi:hypothetical protein